jgi:hypothetical protein
VLPRQPQQQCLRRQGGPPGHRAVRCWTSPRKLLTPPRTMVTRAPATSRLRLVRSPTAPNAFQPFGFHHLICVSSMNY